MGQPGWPQKPRVLQGSVRTQAGAGVDAAACPVLIMFYIFRLYVGVL